MKRYDESYELTQELLDTLSSYMDTEKREQVHIELAPCTPEEFIQRYCELDDKFEEEIMNNEFDLYFE